MRLLVTRAAADAERTRRKLEAMGHEVIVSPLFETVGLKASWPRGIADAVLATSAQAFEVAVAGPPPETRRLLPLYLVGARTAEAARAAGFLGAALVEPSGTTLAKTLAQRAFPPRRTVYLAGKDRKPHLETSFETRGLRLDVVEVYAAQAAQRLSPAAVRAFERHGLDSVLHYSRRGASVFVQTAAESGILPSRAAHFCLSEDVAAPLREAGCVAIQVAEEPSEADLLALVGRSETDA